MNQLAGAALHPCLEKPTEWQPQPIQSSQNTPLLLREKLTTRSPQINGKGIITSQVKSNPVCKTCAVTGYKAYLRS
jgi:hypothetical protein